LLAGVCKGGEDGGLDSILALSSNKRHIIPDIHFTQYGLVRAKQ